MTKNVLVLGGAGFIGSHIVDALIEKGRFNVTVLDNFFLGAEQNISSHKEDARVDFVHADATDLSTLQEVIKSRKIDIIYNLAVIPLITSLEFPVWSVQVNTAILQNCCELIRSGYADELIHFSSSEAYGSGLWEFMSEDHPLNPTTPYAASKAAGDLLALSYVETFGTKIKILRPFNNYGPRQNSRAYAGIIPIVAQRLSQGLPIQVFGDGMQTRDFVFVRDTARAAAQAIDLPELEGIVTNIASGVETSVIQLIDEIAKVMGVRNYELEHLPERKGDVTRHCGQSIRMEEIFGWKIPPLSALNLEETIRFYQK